MEVWKDVDGYNGLYDVSNYGRIRNHKKKNILHPSTDKGYKHICLRKNGVTKCYKVHRLVALAFIPNPDNKPQINHIDENRSNNNVENLEWCTAKYNSNYRERVKRMSKSHEKKVSVYDDKGNKIKTYESILIAAKENNLDSSSITKCCKHKRKMCGGMRWEYERI